MAMQVIEEGPRNLVVKVDTAPATVDVSALNPPCEELRIMKIIYDSPSTNAGKLEWDATIPVLAFSLSGPGDHYNFCRFGGLVNNGGAGVTGDVIITPDSATVVVEFKKVRPTHPWPN